MEIRKIQYGPCVTFKLDKPLKTTRELREVLSLLKENGYGDYPIFISGYEKYDYITVPLIDYKINSDGLYLIYDEDKKVIDVDTEDLEVVENQLTVNQLLIEEEDHSINIDKIFTFKSVEVENGVVNIGL